MISINIYEIVMQIVNFMILLYLLKRFLFTPLISFLDKREETIGSAISSAEDNKVKAAELLEKQEKLLKDARLEARDLRQKAEEAGKKEREQVLNQAKKEASQLIESARNDLAQDVERAKKELVNFTGDLSIKITKNIVKTDLSDSQHQQVVKSYLEVGA